MHLLLPHSDWTYCVPMDEDREDSDDDEDEYKDGEDASLWDEMQTDQSTLPDFMKLPTLTTNHVVTPIRNGASGSDGHHGRGHAFGHQP